MPRITFLWALSCLPFAAVAADDGRVRFLEQEVRRMQQQVQSLSRRLDELERPDLKAPAARPRAPASPQTSDAWIDAAKWRRVRAGMSELEVIELLGPPTSMREIDGEHVLFYALEVGSSGFLGGSVRFRDRAVSAVEAPVLQ
jgi:hypothetical protein